MLKIDVAGDLSNVKIFRSQFKGVRVNKSGISCCTINQADIFCCDCVYFDQNRVIVHYRHGKKAIDVFDVLLAKMTDRFLFDTKPNNPLAQRLFRREMCLLVGIASGLIRNISWPFIIAAR